jgi:hypothetical protein
MKPLSRPLAFTFLLGSLGLIGWGSAPSFPNPVVSPQLQGPPVQGRAHGGYALTSYAPNDAAATYSITQIVVSSSTTGENGTATYTITISPAATLTVGESVTISGLTGNFTVLNNVAPVLAGNLTPTTFSVSTSDVYASSFHFPRGAVYATIADGTYDTMGTDNFGTNGVVTVSSTAPSANPRDPAI